MTDTVRAQPGPQTAFLACEADIAIYGGSAGSGKSFGLLLDGARGAPHAGFSGVILRRTAADLRKSGGLWDKGSLLYRRIGARTRSGAELDATWRSGARLQFSGCEHEKDVEQWQGPELGFVGLDELTHFTSYQFWYLVTRMRSTAGVRPYLRATCNPEPDHWVYYLIQWWIDQDTGLPIPERSGVLRWIIRDVDGDKILNFATREEAQAYLDKIGDTDGQPKSLTFIAAKLSDNPALEKADPNYRGNLAMQDKLTRAKLLDGNWHARVKAGAFFSRTWFDVLDAMPTPDEIWAAARGWDLAGGMPTAENTNPDWTVGALLLLLRTGRIVIADIVRVRVSPATVDALIESTVRLDGPAVTQAIWQDPAAAGLRDCERLKLLMRRALASVDVRSLPTTKNKIAYASPLSARLEPRAGIVRPAVVAGAWNLQLFNELEAFGGGKDKDDQVDALSRAWVELSEFAGGGLTDFLTAMKRAY